MGFFHKIKKSVKRGFKKVSHGVKSVASHVSSGTKSVANKVASASKSIAQKTGNVVKTAVTANIAGAIGVAEGFASGGIMGAVQGGIGNALGALGVGGSDELTQEEFDDAMQEGLIDLSSPVVASSSPSVAVPDSGAVVSSSVTTSKSVKASWKNIYNIFTSKLKK